jgi:actin-related protein 10
LWGLSRAADLTERAEEERLLAVKLEKALRYVFHEYAMFHGSTHNADRYESCLLTDPKARKVILIEQPLLPIYIKDLLARILFENLQVNLWT